MRNFDLVKKHITNDSEGQAQSTVSEAYLSTHSDLNTDSDSRAIEHILDRYTEKLMDKMVKLNDKTTEQISKLRTDIDAKLTETHARIAVAENKIDKNYLEMNEKVLHMENTMIANSLEMEKMRHQMEKLTERNQETKFQLVPSHSLSFTFISGGQSGLL